MIKLLRAALLLMAVLAGPVLAADDNAGQVEDGDAYVEDGDVWMEDGDGAGMFSPMMNAAQMDDWETLRRLARTQCPPRDLEPDMTVLHHAAMRADSRTVACLLQAGADRTVKDNYGRLPWDYALQNAQLDAATRDMLSVGRNDAVFDCIRERRRDDLLRCMQQERYRSARNDDGDTPLLFAARCGYWDYVFTLLELKPDIYARNHEGQNLLLFVFKDSINADQAGRIAALYDRRAYADRQGRSPVHYAAGQSTVDGTQKLLLALTFSPDINATDQEGMTPLAAALRYGKTRQASALVALGADVSRYPAGELDERLSRNRLSDSDRRLIEAFKAKGTPAR